MKDQEYFNKFAQDYGVYQVYRTQEYERILDASGIKKEAKDKRILEIGCGSGAFSFRLAKSGFQVVGMDICAKLIKLTSKENKMNAAFVVADGLNLPFKNESFDLIFCGAFLHHLPGQIPSLLSDFFRVLRAKGKVYFFEPYSPCLNSLLHYWVFKMNRTEDERAINPNKLKHKFKKNGFVNFQWQKIKKIKYADSVYFLEKDPLVKRIIGLVRKLTNEYLIPNICFVGSVQKAEKAVKKIIVSTHDSLYPIRGGGAIRTLKTAEEFKRRGHRIIIIAPADRINEVSGIKMRWLYPPRKQYSQILSSLKFNLRLLIKFLQSIEETDIFFIHNTIAAACLPLLKIFFPFKFVLDITDIHAEYLSIGKRNIFEKILTPYILKYEYYIIKSADFIIVVTKAMKNLLISKGIAEKKIRVVYDGTDIEEFSTQKEPGSEYGVIHLGIIDRQHGVELFTQTIPIILKEYPNARFFFVGGGREVPNIKKMAVTLGVMNNCVFTNHLSCEQARRYLKKAVIGVIPRRDCLPNRIITTLKLYEYWASATAVISSGLEGIKEIAEDRKDILVFESSDVKELARKVIFLLHNKNVRNDLIKNGLITVEKFQWKNLIPKIADFSLDSGL